MILNDGEIKLCEWQYRKTGGFYTALFTACTKADNINLARLSLAFPQEVLAFKRYSQEEGYWDKVKEAYIEILTK